MRQAASDLGRKALALGVLLLAAFLVFKVVLGIVSTIVWFAVALIALFAVVWAVRTL